MAALGPLTADECLLGLDSVLPLLGVLARAGQPVLIERSYVEASASLLTASGRVLPTTAA